MAKRIVRVFLDSNVILSGLLSDKGVPRIILDLLTLELPFLVGSTGRYNLIEIERNLKRKMPQILVVYKKYLPRLNLKVIPIPHPEELRKFAGKITDKDISVLVSAIRSEADFLVTGDKRQFQRIKLLDGYLLKVVTPSQFIDLLLPEVLKEIGKVD